MALVKKMRVAPLKPGSSAASSNGSRFLESIASLSPSQLDHALMTMLNIDQERTGIKGMCEGNPIPKSGKRMQLIQMIGLSMIPILVLLIWMI